MPGRIAEPLISYLGDRVSLDLSETQANLVKIVSSRSLGYRETYPKINKNFKRSSLQYQLLNCRNLNVGDRTIKVDMLETLLVKIMGFSFVSSK